MKPIFISYRRKDTQDVVGRLFDRLSGYFGPGLVLLDVDALVAGGNYRTQIQQLLKDCSVVLVVIGREWLTMVDAEGRRRIDDPDDQLRIEVETALTAGRTVIPVLVHDAAMPTAAELPDAIKPLAACEPHYVQSGAAFNADLWHLIVRLGDAGIRPVEAKFPWHMVLMTAGLALLGLALASGSFLPYEQTSDYALQQLDLDKALPELRLNPSYAAWDGKPYDRARYDRRLLLDAVFTLAPLTLGPILIVWGKRKCCLNKERDAARYHYGQGAGRLPTPKSGKSILCLALGVASFGAGLFAAIPAVLVGGLAWREIVTHRTWIRGRSLVVFGLLAAMLGGAISVWLVWPQWRSRQWLASMEQAHAAAQAGDDAAQLKALDRALAQAAGEFRHSSLTNLKRAEAFRKQEKRDEALAALTAAIDEIEAAIPPLGGPDSDCENVVWQTARTWRGEILEAQGETARAREDFRRRDWGLFNRTGADDMLQEGGEFEDAPPAPAAPEAEPAPEAPPAPIADPTARRRESPRASGLVARLTSACSSLS
ncbi:MAG: toll/interleukin-1 receptor domain-containing protein [Pirellulales bacterium]|nr:toll/interleukin-1 receptor domain-containing protein [Pirellulales bacterium]